MAKKVLIAGGSGLIGSRLTELLLRKGFEVSHLGRTKRLGKVPGYVWNIKKGTIDRSCLDGVNVVINLAGAGVAERRWTESRKREILDSRIQSTALLCRELRDNKHTVTSYVSASAIGVYGLERGGEWITESASPGTDFLAGVVKLWEEEADKISLMNIRVVKLRTGIVLSKKGGALQAMAAPVRYGCGAVLGTGKQYQSWIHEDDLCAIYIKAAEDQSMKGPYNAVGVQPVTNLMLTRAIATALNRPLWLPPIPGFMLKILLGEVADMVIYGARVSPEKMMRAGFGFRFTEINAALKDLLWKP